MKTPPITLPRTNSPELQDSSFRLAPGAPARPDRRAFLGGAAAALAVAALPSLARAAERDWTGRVPTRYPDPDIISLDKRFKAKLGNTPIQRLYHSADMLWAEGPAWNGVGRYLLWSVDRRGEEESFELVEAKQEELKRVIRADYSLALSALVSIRVILLQAVPELTILTVFASTMSGTPTFVYSEN